MIFQSLVMILPRFFDFERPQLSPWEEIKKSETIFGAMNIMNKSFFLSKFSSTPVTMLIYFAKRFARIFLRLHQLQIDGKTVTIATESVDFRDLTGMCKVVGAKFRNGICTVVIHQRKGTGVHECHELLI